MKELEIEGKTVEEAIKEGLRTLNCSRENAEIKILDEGSSGLFGLMGNKPAKVRISSEKNLLEGIDLAKAQENAKKTIAEILKLMGISLTSAKTSVAEERIHVELTSPESSLIIGKNGQTLDALETILNLILSKNKPTRIKTDIDIENYRKRQEERLNELAHKAGEQARQTGKVFRLEPMSARERRIIHTALKASEDLETFSEGEGAVRKVVVKPILKRGIKA